MKRIVLGLMFCILISGVGNMAARKDRSILMPGETEESLLTRGVRRNMEKMQGRTGADLDPYLPGEPGYVVPTSSPIPGTLTFDPVQQEAEKRRKRAAASRLLRDLQSKSQ